MGDVADAQTITSLSVVVPPSNYVIVNIISAQDHMFNMENRDSDKFTVHEQRQVVVVHGNDETFRPFRTSVHTDEFMVQLPQHADEILRPDDAGAAG